MNALKAHVENGRIVMDDPTDLPEGTVLHMVPVNDGSDLGDEERAALDGAIEEGIDDFEQGRFEDFSKVLTELRARP